MRNQIINGERKMEDRKTKGLEDHKRLEDGRWKMEVMKICWSWTKVKMMVTRTNKNGMWHYHETHLCCQMLFCTFSLLEQGYSHCQVHQQTGLGLGTISRIGRGVNSNKENNPSGHSTTLSTHNKQSILHQITLAHLIMLSRLQFLSILPFPILLILRLSEMH